MYSKSPFIATVLACLAGILLLASCHIAPPWQNEPVGEEVNIVFTLEKNLVLLPSATLDGRPGRFLFGSAEPHTLVDPRFSRAASHSLQLNERESFNVPSASVDLGGVADAIVGGDAWGTHAVTLDYRAGVLTFQREGIHPELMTLFAFVGEPMVNLLIDGRSVNAVVDTASPDTVILPRDNEKPSRRNARIQLANTDLGTLDIRYADVSTPRVGNRILSKFLVTIDYGTHQVGLWRDPRIRL